MTQSPTSLVAVILSVALLASTAVANEENERGFIRLFNGKDLTGWRISENGKWTVEDGMIVTRGSRSHLFTVDEFKNFEFQAEVKTTPGSNSSIIFHTKFQQEGWPDHGYDSQINVSHKDNVKSGSLKAVDVILTPTHKDDKWYTHEIIVKSKNIVVKINGKTVINYTEPDDNKRKQRLSKGSFALQCHHTGSVVYFRNIRVKPLPD